MQLGEIFDQGWDFLLIYIKNKKKILGCNFNINITILITINRTLSPRSFSELIFFYNVP
jgi:hypothetical protein